MNDALAASWRRTERALRDAAAGLLSGTDTEMALDYLAHNELGLAFDHLVAAAQEHSASDLVWVALASAATEMKLMPDDPVHGASVRAIHDRS